MNKQEFLRALKKKLSRLSKKDVQERLNFYSEMIDDRIEEGLSEEEAVAAVGSIQEVAEQIISEASDAKSGDGDHKGRRLKVWEIVFLAVGSPIWAPILAAVFITVWALVLSLWAVELPFLIFYYISKVLFVVCKRVTVFCFCITKKTFLGIKGMF